MQQLTSLDLMSGPVNIYVVSMHYKFLKWNALRGQMGTWRIIVITTWKRIFLKLTFRYFIYIFYYRIATTEFYDRLLKWEKRD